MKKNEIFNSEYEIMDVYNTKKDKNIQKYIYKNIFLCPLNKNDCVNSMDIFDDILIYGTIMGNVNLCRVDKNNLKLKKEKINKNDMIHNIKSISQDINKKNDIEIKEMKNTKKDDEKEIQKIPCIKIQKLDKNTSNINNKITPNTNNNMTYGNSNNIKDNGEEQKQKEKMDNNKINNIKKNSILINSNKIIKEISDIKKTNESYSIPQIHDNLNTVNNNINSNVNNNIKDNDINNIEYNNIDFPQITNLIINASENISCVIFNSKDNVIISIGDLEIIKLEKISTFNINDVNSKYDYTRVRNYCSEEDHIINCENTTCFLTTSNYLMVNTIFEENNSPITMQQVPYQNKILSNLDIIKGNIEMFNFCVPFDFDGDKFLFLDYQTKYIRRICVYYTISQGIPPFVHKIDNDFGHISHMKLLDEDRIFICRKYTQCQIYKINSDFTLLEEWMHIGEEIIAVDIYINGTKISEDQENNYYKININDNNDNDNEEIHTNNDIDKIQYTRKNIQSEEKEIKRYNNNHKKNIFVDINKSNNSSFRELEYNNKWNYKKKYKEENYFDDNYNKNKLKNSEEIQIYNINKFKSKNKNKDYNNLNHKSDDEFNLNLKNNHLKLRANEVDTNKAPNIKNTQLSDEDKISIATLDLNGNLNLYKNKKNKVLFNLYKIEGIEKRYKDEEFFSVGFPYFITMNSKFIAISTDHGIFVITKCKK